MTDTKRIVAEIVAKETWETWQQRGAPHAVEVCDKADQLKALEAGFWPGFLMTKNMSGTECEGQELPRATIAACAPEALRLLMRAEWASLGRYDTELCPWCRGDGHEADCEFVALMKKAGLR